MISRHWNWWEAWAYSLLSIFSFLVSRSLIAWQYPDLIAERVRSQQHEDAQAWDKRLAPLMGLGGILVLMIAGLDELRGWSPAFSLAV